MKELILSPIVGTSFYKAFTRSWFGFICLSSLGLMISLHRFLSASFYLWKYSFLPYSEKKVVNMFFEIVSISFDETILKISSLFLLWSFLRLFIDPIYEVVMFPLEKLWRTFGEVSDGHGHCSYDTADWYDVVPMRFFRFKRIEFIVSTQEFAIVFSIFCYSLSYLLLRDYLEWWAVLIALAGCSIYWISVNEIRYAISNRSSERHKERVEQALDKGVFYLPISLGLIFLSFFISYKFKDYREQRFNNQTLVEVCTINGDCFEGNYLIKSQYRHIVTKGSSVIAFPEESISMLKFIPSGESSQKL